MRGVVGSVPRRRYCIAIFSLHHSPVGRSTHAPRTAGYHCRYITRPGALVALLGARMPVERHAARRWLDRVEKTDRRNARVIDRVMVALPRELDHAQRLKLVRAYAEAVTKGRASWLAAVHGDRPANPHVHFIFRDRDAMTGKRVMLTTERGSTQRLRHAWEHQVNYALACAGSAARVDARSLAAQGIDRVPEVHRGPRPQPVSAPPEPLEAAAGPSPAVPAVVATAARSSLFRSLFGAAARLVVGRLVPAFMLARPQLLARARRRDGLRLS